MRIRSLLPHLTEEQRRRAYPFVGFASASGSGALIFAGYMMMAEMAGSHFFFLIFLGGCASSGALFIGFGLSAISRIGLLPEHAEPPNPWVAAE